MTFPNRIFDLYYGATGSGKSRAIAQMISALHKQTGKKARVWVGDGSAITYDHLVNQGIAEVAEFSHRPWPFDVIKRIVSGWWPADQFDPQSPLVDPTKQADLKDIGIWVIEGASVMGQYCMGGIKGGLAEQAGRGIKIGQDSPIQILQGETDKTGKLIEGPGTTVGGNPIAHYNVGQRAITDAVQQSRGLGRYVFWTAHEATNDPSQSQLNKELIVGPEVVGKALTASFQRMFGNTPHFQTVAKKGKAKDDFTGKDVTDLDLDFRIYTRDHFTPDGNTMIRYKALTRGVDNDQFPQSFDNIYAYYSALLEAQQKEVDITTLV